MLYPVKLVIVALLSILVLPAPARNEKQANWASKILLAKSVYFDDRSGAEAVGQKALERLEKWGRFKIVKDKRDADLVFLLSSDPYKGGYVIFSGGQTGTIDKKTGDIRQDEVPTFNKQAPVRYAYLTVIDPRTGDSVWSAEHQWGGLLTGLNSAGARLINELRKQVEK